MEQKIVHPQDMEILTAYEVTKGSSDGTVGEGALVWLSENCDLNHVSIYEDGRASFDGWLNRDEWNEEGINDFEVRRSEKYFIDLSNGRESIKSISKIQKKIDKQLKAEG